MKIEEINNFVEDNSNIDTREFQMACRIIKDLLDVMIRYGIDLNEIEL